MKNSKHHSGSTFSKTV